MKYCTEYTGRMKDPYVHTKVGDYYGDDLRLRPESSKDFRLLLKISKFLNFTVFSKNYGVGQLDYKSLRRIYEEVQSNR